MKSSSQILRTTFVLTKRFRSAQSNPFKLSRRHFEGISTRQVRFSRSRLEQGGSTLSIINSQCLVLKRYVPRTPATLKASNVVGNIDFDLYHGLEHIDPAEHVVFQSCTTYVFRTVSRSFPRFVQLLPGSICQLRHPAIHPSITRSSSSTILFAAIPILIAFQYSHVQPHYAIRQGQNILTHYQCRCSAVSWHEIGRRCAQHHLHHFTMSSHHSSAHVRNSQLRSHV